MKNPMQNLLTVPEQKAMLYVLTIMILGYGLQLFGWTPKSVAKDDDTVKKLESKVDKDVVPIIDIRTASKEELCLLPGIGEKRADDIIAFRQKQGFSSVNQIMLVKGIGKATYEKMKPSLLIFGDDSPLEKKAGSSGSKTKRATGDKDVPKDELTAPVDLNKASLAEICTLSGIGEVKGKAIIAYREANGGFKSIDEITKVKGIGEKTFAKIKDRLRI